MQYDGNCYTIYMSQDIELGQQLIADFQTAVLSVATSSVASHEASRSEEDLMGFLSNVSRGTYLQPGRLAENEQQIITRASVDAHLKKAQAEQVQKMSRQQIAYLNDQNEKKWRGRKVKIQVLSPERQPIKGVYFDQRNGSRMSPMKGRFITGVVEDILLEKNTLILRPTVLGKWTHTGLQGYIVSIIDPATFVPMVKIA